MHEAERLDFGAALHAVFEVYGKGLPDTRVIEHWWRALAPFPPEVIADAFEQHIGASTYAPLPAEIRTLCMQLRRHQVGADTMRLAYTPKADAEIASQNLAQLRELTRTLGKSCAGVAWAFVLLDRGTSRSGEPLTSEVLRVAGDAVLSSAGRHLIDSVRDDALRARYEAIYRAVVAQRRSP
ncbi:hypothetical protein WM28_10700 [Burkholderia ubonensis]|uniref:hypothetical protein n=1 Tax=Burkholderia ubonensis TaxID=101571 RepID=UPI00075F9249|nr:hypothetical protein [Burkholderia ubonensis]KWO52942.1 hypothetical protein WM28_10700 [Burkholderia ubonensis]